MAQETRNNEPQKSVQITPPASLYASTWNVKKIANSTLCNCALFTLMQNKDHFLLERARSKSQGSDNVTRTAIYVGSETGIIVLDYSYEGCGSSSNVTHLQIRKGKACIPECPVEIMELLSALTILVELSSVIDIDVKNSALRRLADALNECEYYDNVAFAEDTPENSRGELVAKFEAIAEESFVFAFDLLSTSTNADFNWKSIS